MISKYIDKKNNGNEYTYQELEEIVLGYTHGKISDQDMTEFLRSIFIHGLSSERTADLTEIMMNSGKVIDLSKIPGIKVDKHSTGGVGDKVTLIIAPLVAALGASVAKMSGRGLGFTGGTLDKLESIPGYNINPSYDEFIQNVKTHGVAVIGQTDDLVPADKKMYALRDETNLVESMPLIASSIMSKKLATGSDAILLDVKCGNAAFMKTEKEAVELAEAMIKLGKFLNKDIRVEITSMDKPLGRAIGNKLEVLEAIEFLKGKYSDDLKEVVFSSASTMLVQAKIFQTEKEALSAVEEIIVSGKALKKFNEWIDSQGGDVEIIHTNKFWNPKYYFEIKATKSGFMYIKSAVNFGIAAMKLGAGREKKEDNIDFDAGIYIDTKSAEIVEKDQVLFTLFSNSEIPKEIIKSLKTSYEITDRPIISKVILNKIS